MEWQEGGKEHTGWLPYRTMGTPLGSPQLSPTPRVNSREASPVTSTGSSLSTSKSNNLYDPFGSCLDRGTLSLLEAKLAKTTFGSRILESREPSLSLENDRCSETSQPIGSKSGSPLRKEELETFPQTYVYVVISHCEASARHMSFQLGVNEWLISIGAELVLASREELGEKQEWTLTLKIRALNFGVDTKIRGMLLSMSFEEVSIFPICLDGWIDIQSGWRSKAQACPCVLKSFGSRVMFIQQNGGRNWTLQH